MSRCGNVEVDWRERERERERERGKERERERERESSDVKLIHRNEGTICSARGPTCAKGLFDVQVTSSISSMLLIS